jgi:intracellular sulfur oxidation DsrE/DsrF family protein
MDRRSIVTSLFAATGAVFASATGARANPIVPDKAKVVYHLTDLDKVSFVLRNIRNHFDGMGGPDKVTVVLVVHGPALKAFHTASANPEHVRRMHELAKAGVEFAACGMMMAVQKVALKDLLPGFVELEQGGVVRLAELQSQGYVYLRL